MYSKFNIDNRRYIGSKSKIVEEIIKELRKYKYNSFLDLFGGTGVVAYSVSEMYSRIGVNDILYSNNVIYNAFFGKGRYSKKKLESIAEKYQDIKPKKTFFSDIYQDTYFTKEECEKIGAIREEIEKEEVTLREKNILIASLLYSADRSANTVGHYEAYFKNNKNTRSFEFNLIIPTDLKFEIYKEDANELVKNVKYDVVYIDPPYNSRQYSRFYHVLETIVKWEEFEPEGVAKKPPVENMSDYCRSNASDKLQKLIEDVEAKLIILSYNNTYTSKSKSSQNKISFEEINKIMKAKGKLTIKEIKHKYFNSGKTEFNNHKEYLFICEVE